MTSISAGMATGAVIGHNSGSGNRDNSRAIGAVTGAVISGIAGYFIHRGIERKEAEIRRQTLFNLDKYDVSVPHGFEQSSTHGLTAPKIESEWVPTQVVGKKLIEGHKVFIITDEARWIPGKNKKKKKK